MCNTLIYQQLLQLNQVYKDMQLWSYAVAVMVRTCTKLSISNCFYFPHEAALKRRHASFKALVGLYLLSMSHPDDAPTLVRRASGLLKEKSYLRRLSVLVSLSKYYLDR